jgi:two-component system NtrC family sensor kinase
MAVEPAAKILLVDDAEQNRYILSRILSRAGFSVDEAATGREALARVLESPDLIILDVKLPDISGYEVCRRIKNNWATSSIPILQMSAAFTTSESKVMALEGGADGYLSHPVDSTVLVATVRAMLRLKQAETIMRQSAQQWQSTFDALSEGLLLLDNDNCVVRCNRAFTELSGLSFKEIIGANGTGILQHCVGPNHLLAEPLQDRGSIEVQHRGHWFHVRVDQVKTREQRFGAIVVVSNIRERKMAEETLRNSEKLAATGRMAHTIAHEINNPLEALTNLIYLAQISSEQPEVQGYLTQAQNELNRVSRITKQVLSSNRETSRPVPVDFKEILETVLTLYEGQFETKSVKLRYQCTSAPAVVEGFPGELRQVMANLLGNAIDAAPPRWACVIAPAADAQKWHDRNFTGNLR